MKKAKRRVVKSRKPRKCPACGHTPLATILYGRPAFDENLEKEMKEGLVTFGGCCVTVFEDPKWESTKCGLQIYKKTEELNCLYHNIEKISFIEFEVGGFPSGYHNIKLLSTNDGATLVYQEPLERGKHTKYLDHTTWIKLLDSLEECKYDKWDEKYRDDNILDGEQWEFIITYNGYGTVKRYGSNAYPSNWNKFLKVFQNLLTFDNNEFNLE